jgi:hypothetical protein
MSLHQRHIKSQSTTTYEEPYVIIKRPTNATFIPTQIMEINEEKTSVRQACESIHAESKLAENKETEGQT